jgi:hypothetical protein
MAKKNVSEAPQVEEELSVVVLKFKGSGETVRKGVDAVTQAIAALGGPATVVTRHVNGRKPAQLAAPAADTIDTEVVQEDEDTELETEEQETETPAGTKGQTKPRKFEFVSTVSDNAKTPLKDFIAQRGPTEINDKYLVACLWLQTEAGFDVFTPNHVWSCFQIMDWKKLADFTQPMRLMKSKKSYFDSPKRGEWKLNAHGLDVAKAIQPAP